MNSASKGFGSVIIRSGIAAISAVCAAALSLGLAQTAPAQAADIDSYSLGSSNAGSSAMGSGMGAGKASPKLAEACAKVDELQEMMNNLELQLDAISDACYQLTVLNDEAQKEVADNAGQNEALLAQLEEAQRVFSEQVASVLSPETVSLVSNEIAATQSSMASSDEQASVSEELSNNIKDLSERITVLTAAYKDMSDVCAAAVGSARKSRSNISNN